MTATPERADGRGLGAMFDAMVLGPTASQLIEAGHLSPFVIYQPDRAPVMKGVGIRAGDFKVEELRAKMGGVVIGSAVEEYRRLCNGAPAVAFCVDVEHSRAVAAAFCAAGVRAQHVDGESHADHRRTAVAALGNGNLDIITNCSLFDEGVDIPVLGAAILLRPTCSLSLYLQQVGRALRPAPGKGAAIILDFAGNTMRHGLPDAPREWSLEAKARRQRPKSQVLARRCKFCGVVSRPSATVCSGCGRSLIEPKSRAEIMVELRLSRQAEDAAMLREISPRERVAWAGADIGRLHLVAAVSGYKPGWAWHRSIELRSGARA